jgi:PAS domain S-box-containing protein
MRAVDPILVQLTGAAMRLHRAATIQQVHTIVTDEVRRLTGTETVRVSTGAEVAAGSSMLSVPMLDRGGHRLGAIEIGGCHDAENDEERRSVVEQLAAFAAAAVENLRDRAELQASADAAQAQLRTTLQATEAALQRSRRILDSSLDVVAVLDLRGRFVDVSSRCSDVWGYRPDELVGRSCGELMHADDRPLAKAAAAAIAATRRGGEVQNRFLHRNGRVVHMRWSAVWSEQDRQFYAYARDVGDRLAIEEKLRQSQRLEAIGQLTGGIAHDFNNLLTVILGSADTVIRELPAGHRLRATAEMMRTAAERGADLTSDLLAFARRQVLEPKVTDVNRLVAATDGLLRRALHGDVQIELVRGGAVWPVLIDPAQLEAALLNLAINARDAMPGGGRLTIETANVQLDDSYAAMHDDVTPGQYVMVAVGDTGAGMDTEAVRRAFEPFYTTKEVGQGSGLGLSMVYGFTKQSGGHAKVYSEVGYGTVVKLYLPRADGTPHVDVQDGTEPDRGAERILLVEDDDLVRVHVENQLRSLGYHVTAVRDGRTALETLHQDQQFDLLFTDVVMPGGINGRELADAAQQIRPQLPVLFTSGFTENAIVTQGRLDPDVHLIQKPYRRQELASKLRAVLRAPA